MTQSQQLRKLAAQAYAGQQLCNGDGEVVGMIFVLFRQPLTNHDFVTSTLRIFASRASAEIDLTILRSGIFTSLAVMRTSASPLRAFMTVSLPLAAPGLMASAIFVFLISLDEFSGTFFVGVPDVRTLPLTMLNAALEGNYQIASITALLLLVPSILFMLFVERFLKADVLANVGK